MNPALIDTDILSLFFRRDPKVTARVHTQILTKD